MRNVNAIMIAVSGGVDSMVLLDALFHDRLNELVPNFQPLTSSTQLIVAHFDHGIREDSSTDEEFVRGVVGDYGLEFVSERAELGASASEETARTMRYNFLRRCCKKYNALLFTAHHQDDLLETMVINLIRGTGWRGLVSLNSNAQTIRPLLHTSKAQILEYASRHAVQWREDSTNTNQAYLRNYVRRTILQNIHTHNQTAQAQLLKINEETSELKNEIATELQKIQEQFYHHASLPRYQLIMWPRSVAHEVLYQLLTSLDSSWHPDSYHIIKALHFAKTAKPSKQLQISKHLTLVAKKRVLQFKKS